MRHFSEKFREPELNRPQLKGIIFSVLSHSDMSSLEFNFLEQEIKEVVSGCEGSKSSGPGVYNFVFIRNCWLFVKYDFVRLFKDFHGKSKLSKSIASSFLTLTPKNNTP